MYGVRTRLVRIGSVRVDRPFMSPQWDNTTMSTNTEPKYTRRKVKIERWRDGYVATVVLIDVYDDPEFGERPSEPRHVQKFALLPAATIAEYVDVVRGEVPESDEGRVMVHIGSDFGKHYYTSHDGRTIPEDVGEALSEKGFVLATNVDGGWVQWNGRPEFSDNYVDFSEARVVRATERSNDE